MVPSFLLGRGRGGSIRSSRATCYVTHFLATRATHFSCDSSIRVAKTLAAGVIAILEGRDEEDPKVASPGKQTSLHEMNTISEKSLKELVKKKEAALRENGNESS